MLEFDTSVFGGEVPVRLGVMDIAVALPGSDFVDESLFVGNAAVEVPGCVVPFEPLDQPSGFGRRESLSHNTAQPIDSRDRDGRCVHKKEASGCRPACSYLHELLCRSHFDP